MRRAVLGLALLGAFAIFAAPVNAQTTDNPWVLNAGFGPSFGTFGTTPTVGANLGYRFNDRWSIVGEAGIMTHAPFEKAAPVAPPVSAPGNAIGSAEARVNGYPINLNLRAAPAAWGRVTPYFTGGLGAFTGTTTATFDLGPATTRYASRDTHFATNVGGGMTFKLSRWLGINADYRHFLVDADRLEHLNRLTTGVTLFVND